MKFTNIPRVLWSLTKRNIPRTILIAEICFDVVLIIAVRNARTPQQSHVQQDVETTLPQASSSTEEAPLGDDITALASSDAPTITPPPSNPPASPESSEGPAASPTPTEAPNTEDATVVSPTPTPATATPTPTPTPAAPTPTPTPTLSPEPTPTTSLVTAQVWWYTSDGHQYPGQQKLVKITNLTDNTLLASGETNDQGYWSGAQISANTTIKVETDGASQELNTGSLGTMQNVTLNIH